MFQENLAGNVKAEGELGAGNTATLLQELLRDCADFACSNHTSFPRALGWETNGTCLPLRRRVGNVLVELNDSGIVRDVCESEIRIHNAILIEY
jgi:hypothetical protein